MRRGFGPAPWPAGRTIAAIAVLSVPLAGRAGLAAEVGVGIAAKKLVVVDRTASGKPSKVTFTSRDGGSGIDAGSGDDPAGVSASFRIAYAGGGPSTSFAMRSGAYDGLRGWRLVPGQALFSHKLGKSEPPGATTAKVKTGAGIDFGATGTGDVPLDFLAAGAPAAGVTTAFSITDRAGTRRHCSLFDTCSYKSGASGVVLTCKDGRATPCPTPTPAASPTPTPGPTATPTPAPTATPTPAPTATPAPPPTPTPAPFQQVTKAVMPTTLYVIHGNTLTSAQRSLVASLQGLVSRTSAEQIYLHPDFGGYQTWLLDLQTNWGVELYDVNDPWWLVDHFRSRIAGYLLYSGPNDSLNAATSLAGVEDSIVVESSIESQAILRGLSKRMDLTGRNEAWVVQNHGSRLNPKVAFEQLEGFADELRDYAVLSRALLFHDGNSAFRSGVVDGLADDAMTMGWGDASGGEDVFVGASSDRGVFTIAADYAHNLAPLSGVPIQILEQATHVTPVAEADVHYVSFVMTDGDNLQWVLGQFQNDGRWFGSPYRGTFDMGYGMPPVLAELAPSVLGWYYAHASTGPGRDHFVVGPSGGGYFYPSRFPPGVLAAHVDRLADWMAVADLGLVQILDAGALERRDLWDLYTAKPGIDGLFYLEYSDYSGGAGRVVWSNGKPVIAARTKLWEGLANSDVASVRSFLNGSLRDPTSSLGYSMVPVVAWDDAMTKTKAVVDGLDSNVRVVTPEALVKLMQQNVPHGLGFQHDYTTSEFGIQALNLVGNALWVSDPGSLFLPWSNRLRLTSNNGGQNGSAWSQTRIDPSKSWETTFRFQISYPVGGGADGLAFHLQSDGASANPGYLGNFANPSLSVVVDTWDNGEGTSESLKVRRNGIQVLFNDLTDFASDPRPGSSSGVFRATLNYSKATHTLRIRIWDEGGTAYLDNTASVDLDSFGPSWIGFSATTGGSAENHDVRTWQVAAAPAP